MLLGAYRVALDAIVRAFVQSVTPVLRGLDFASSDDRRRLEPILFDLVTRFRGDAVLAANEFMVSEAQSRGGQAYLPAPEPYTVEAIRTTLRESRSSVEVVGALSRHVEMGARRQVQRATPGDDFSPDPPSSYGELGESPTVYPVAWARVLTGADNCPFCVMLASRGAVYSSRTRAGDDGYRFHNHCDCVVVPVFDMDDWPGKSTADYLYGVWRENGSKKALAGWMKENTLKVPDIRAGYTPAA